MSAITTHVLDTSLGKPAAGIQVTLERIEGHGFVILGTGTTDADGRLRTLLPEGLRPTQAVHRLRFEVAPYFAARATTAFFPIVDILFSVTAPEEHHHVPLLLSPFGYSTYRGS